MIDELLERNRDFAEGARPDLGPLPRRGLVILTCMDHRVDPQAALGLEAGDAMVLRNPGGRVNDALLDDLEVLDQVARKRGSALGELELILMEHTECGANALTSTDPHDGVRADLDALAANPGLPDSLGVTGLVYDVNTGRAELVERRAPLRRAG